MKKLSLCKSYISIKNVSCDNDIVLCCRDFSSDLSNLIICLSHCSPYISDLIKKENVWLKKVVDIDVDQAFSQIFDFYKQENSEQLKSYLRVAKRRSNLLILLADFGGLWSLSEVTRALSIFAERVLSVTIDYCVFHEFQKLRNQNYLKTFTNDLNTVSGSAERAGLFALAMGKLGAYELNYSSDIDLIFLFDEEIYKPDHYSDIRTIFIKVVRKMVNFIAQVTDEGYVFRVDLRLRPDPASNPICMGSLAAQKYYETFGRNWERAAFIKARAIVGDKEAGINFLRNIKPFLWRKNLDFSSIDEINKMRQKIKKKNGLVTNLYIPGHNIKTGFGGIREIEFFTQTQQLICGGRNVKLRESETVKALKQLALANWISNEESQKLITYYEKLRFLEHILQLIDDSQTHSIPKNFNKIYNISIMFGEKSVETFINTVLLIVTNSDSITSKLFLTSERTIENNVDQDASVEFVFEDVLSPYLNKWSSYRVLSTERSASLFNELKPLILLHLQKPDSSNDFLFHFDRFLESLSSGVQVLSLFKANPSILNLLMDICGAAPALAEYLSHNPSVLDFVVDRSFFDALPNKTILTRDFKERLNEAGDYEDVLNCARRWVKENQFRTGVHLLKGFSTVRKISESFSNIAEVCLVVLFDKVQEHFSQRYGSIPGLGASILAMGKLGSREMSLGSDLDLIVIYDSSSETLSGGKFKISAPVYFSRLTQSFISAITVATSEGKLFKVDMRLRPSGNKGPVATSLSAFEFYQVNEAWVWERLALSRSRVLNGNSLLLKKLNKIINNALNSKLRSQKVISEVSSMRVRLRDSELDSRVYGNPKYGTGRLQELEILIQMGALLKKSFNSSSPYKMIKDLYSTKFFDKNEAQKCSDAYKYYFNLQQILNIIVTSKIEDGSMKSVQKIFKNHNFVYSYNNIHQALDSYSKDINEIFESKLIYE